MSEPTITVTLGREEIETLVAPPNRIKPASLLKSAKTKLRAALDSPQPERCDGSGQIPTSECRISMSGPTCGIRGCPPCQSPETEPCPSCSACQPERYTVEEVGERLGSEDALRTLRAVLHSTLTDERLRAGLEAALSAAFPDQQPEDEDAALAEADMAAGYETLDFSEPEALQRAAEDGEVEHLCKAGPKEWAELLLALSADGWEVRKSQQPEQEGEAGETWTCWRCTHPLCTRLAQSWEIDHARLMYRRALAGNDSAQHRRYRELEAAALQVTAREDDPPKCIGVRRNGGGVFSHRAEPMELVVVAPAQHPTRLSEDDRERAKQAFALLWVSRNKGPAVKAEAIDSAIDLLRKLADQQGRD